MEPIKTLVRTRKPQKPLERVTERGELYKLFLVNIMPHWDDKRFGKMTIGRIAKKLEGIPTKDLYYLDRVCRDSTNYAKRFFYELNPDKHDHQ